MNNHPQQYYRGSKANSGAQPGRSNDYTQYGRQGTDYQSNYKSYNQGYIQNQYAQKLPTQYLNKSQSTSSYQLDKNPGQSYATAQSHQPNYKLPSQQNTAGYNPGQPQYAQEMPVNTQLVDLKKRPYQTLVKSGSSSNFANYEPAISKKLQTQTVMTEQQEKEKIKQKFDEDYSKQYESDQKIDIEADQGTKFKIYPQTNLEISKQIDQQIEEVKQLTTTSNPNPNYFILKSYSENSDNLDLFKPQVLCEEFIKELKADLLDGVKKESGELNPLPLTSEPSESGQNLRVLYVKQQDQELLDTQLKFEQEYASSLHNIGEIYKKIKLLQSKMFVFQKNKEAQSKMHSILLESKWSAQQ